ncbi:hypothetical protein NST38_30955 [Paenibacillus sp. FSL H8-0104]|uniref:hypothetical protein n=1 Tax=Paenibacillus sp. FSL H8-0104 TaxID=2954509 RepID=UPI0030FD67DA
MSEDQGKIQDVHIATSKKEKHTSPVKETKTARQSMRLLEEDKAFIEYWTKMFKFDSTTDFMIRAAQHYVAWRNQDYDLPTAEMQRLNQLIDAMENMVSSNERLANTVTNGFDAMIGIMRGDNYLIEPENGDLVDERG